MKKSLHTFINWEPASGVSMMFAALLALVWANTGYSYHAVWHGEIFGIGVHYIVNDGLMALFFLVVGLEIKREILAGSLSQKGGAVLPLIAAAGGMAVPAGIYLFLNHANPEAVHGWGVPVATDIAFAVGVLTLLGKCVPVALKVFLLAIAIYDDLGAVIIIALFYAGAISGPALAAIAAVFAGLMLCNRFNMYQLWVYLAGGVLLWLAFWFSGIHASIAGVLLAVAVPLKNIHGRILLTELEHTLKTPVAFIILPIFALANAGVDMRGASLSMLADTVLLGVALGLFIGKPIGIFIATWVAVKCKIAPLPVGVSWNGILGIGLIAGVGFTMSLFVAMLAFADNPTYLNEAKLGILLGSFLSALIGLFYLRMQKHV